MGTICADDQLHHHLHHHHHNLHLLSPNKPTNHPHQINPLLQDLNIPPRKLLSRRTTTASLLPPLTDPTLDFFSDSTHDDTDAVFDPDADPYSSDPFRMFEFKVRRCTRSRSHDWTDCPFAHPGEKARRRDPRRYHYSGTVCPDYRRGACSKGDDCEFAHGVFECWLHPARYRTEACKDGKNCKRKVCFFAHSPRELRILPAQDEGGDHHHHDDDVVLLGGGGKYWSLNAGGRGGQGQGHGHCCKYCCSSPTSTLLGMAAHISPPLSPPAVTPPMSPVHPVPRVAKNWFSPVSRIGEQIESCGLRGCDGPMGFGYKEVLDDLMSSLNLNQAGGGGGGGDVGGCGNGLWVDILDGYDGDDDVKEQGYHQQQLEFVMSPSTPQESYRLHLEQSRNYFDYASCFDSYPLAASGGASIGFDNIEDVGDFKSGNNNSSSDGALVAPDLGWVNDLLM